MKEQNNFWDKLGIRVVVKRSKASLKEFVSTFQTNF
jgi:hypothetical protein